MSQPFVDWELIEAKDFGIYKYHIMKVMDAEGHMTYRGWASTPRLPIVPVEGNAQKSDSLDSLRSSLVTFGLQNS
jgi:hypothetical protein